MNLYDIVPLRSTSSAASSSLVSRPATGLLGGLTQNGLRREMCFVPLP
ncbi:hypothetical protein ACNKHV_25100 [Shigella flexneri]